MSAQNYMIRHLAQVAFQAASAGTAASFGIAAAGSKLFGMTHAAEELDALSQMWDRAARIYGKPAFNLPATSIDGIKVVVSEVSVVEKPYGNLVRFARDTDRNDPKVLLVAPMSGHYATLLRGTVEALLPHHDVHITDWKDVREVPLKHGTFGLGDYARYVEEFIDHIGPHCHVIAVCQPTVPVLAAIALKAARGDNIQPLSMTLMGGPVDTRAAPTSVTQFAEDHSMDFFHREVVTQVSVGFPGAGQPVHAGHNQLMGFVWMNPDRHLNSHRDLFNHLRRGDKESAQKISEFYNEYLSVMDIHAKFYVETVDQVFKRHLLPKNELVLNGETVRPAAITRTALLTIEGEFDDISAPGQTFAAHDLCRNLSQDLHFHHTQPGSGHYGIFNGGGWRREICPRVAGFIRAIGAQAGLDYNGTEQLIIEPSPLVPVKAEALRKTGHASARWMP